MPLRAIIDNKEVISTEFTKDEWTELRKSIKASVEKIILPCCGREGHMRTSKLGLNHFYHKATDGCNYKPESIQHLTAKSEIIRACANNKWTAIPEYVQDDWIADVYATNGKREIAFEVQWSRQTASETHRRQERYKDSGVMTCWFMRKIPKELTGWYGGEKPGRELPIFEIFEDNDGELKVKIGVHNLALFDFTNALFKGHVKYCHRYSTMIKQLVEIRFYEKKCWLCDQVQHGYHLTHGLVTKCGEELHVDEGLWENHIGKHPAVIKAVRDFQNTEEGKHLIIGDIKPRFSRTERMEYLSFGCHYCDALFGDFFNFKESFEVVQNKNLLSYQTEIDFGVSFTPEDEFPRPHWCYSPNKYFCCTKRY